MTPLQMLRHHVTGAIQRGEAVAIVEQRPETLVFTRVKSDTNGNPRYTVDGYALLSLVECADPHTSKARATHRANSIGGRKWPGAFVYVFQSYSVQDTANAIGRVTGRTFTAEKA